MAFETAAEIMADYGFTMKREEWKSAVHVSVDFPPNSVDIHGQRLLGKGVSKLDVETPP
jgi:hypothetical protein